MQTRQTTNALKRSQTSQRRMKSFRHRRRHRRMHNMMTCGPLTAASRPIRIMRASTTARAAKAAAPCQRLNAIKVPCTTMQQHATDPEAVLPYYLQFCTCSTTCNAAPAALAMACGARPFVLHIPLQRSSSWHHAIHGSIITTGCQLRRPSSSMRLHRLRMVPHHRTNGLPPHGSPRLQSVRNLHAGSSASLPVHV